MLTGNKGEWSEAYVFLKLLSEGVLHAADENLQILTDIIYPIIKILRQDYANLEYKVDGVVTVIDGSTGNILMQISKQELALQASRLLSEIKNSEGGAFTVPDIENYLSTIHFRTLKAKSSDKSDITIMVHDQIVGTNATLKFSIKSRLGQLSTLLNPGISTNFIFKVGNGEISDSSVREINNITTKPILKSKIVALANLGITFHEMQSNIFCLNLRVIDSLLPEIVAAMMLQFYEGKATSVKELVKSLSNANPLHFDNQFAHKFYEYKIKNFLADIALGMTPSKVWQGHYDATGGYIIVREDGEVVCYHIYNREKFLEYLINNTKFDIASTHRYGFGNAYKVGNQWFIKLNLQIRFI